MVARHAHMVKYNPLLVVVVVVGGGAVIIGDTSIVHCFKFIVVGLNTFLTAQHSIPIIATNFNAR